MSEQPPFVRSLIADGLDRSTFLSVTGVLCLQGGRELSPPCTVMDASVLARSDGRVVVLAGAAGIGSDYAGSSARAVAHYRGLGAEVAVVPDPREDISTASAALSDGIGLIVMPGGSPGGLLDVLTTIDGGSIGRRIAELWQSGAAISGASAGAMVMCTQTVRPGRDSGIAAAGLGFVDGIAVPHWTPGSERRWSLPDGLVWGLPECGGVIIDGDQMTAVGQGHPSVRVGNEWHRITRDGTEPVPV